MGYIPITPFRRTMDAALLQHVSHPPAPPSGEGISKWDALRELTTGRIRFGLSDRDLTVLQVLISFYPAADLRPGEPLVVFPSNATICARLNGMPCSTMRRHVARLVDSGFLIRRDSPNGKRYLRRGEIAFGFDLAPLLNRIDEIRTAAEAVRAEEARLAALRESLSLMRRDLCGLVALGRIERPALPVWDDCDALLTTLVPMLRRKLSAPELERLQEFLSDALDRVRGTLVVPVSVNTDTVAEEMSTRDAENEQHYHKSNSESHDLKPTAKNQALPRREQTTPTLPDVLSRCTELRNYAPDGIPTWPKFVETVETVRPMMGIAEPVWADAKRTMGPVEAAIVLATMLERYERYRSPGGYLRTLTRKSAERAFSSATMVRALDRQAA
ncbi:plasmid replication protein RepC [Paenirhodobacter enshiensis]|uniref:Uncharacterized protein n=1 Tax=Paenirhodobacter enshiensis TaxID=1105367 RepID=A0A086XR02_9RHOB|nr:plasmid replication protein RepC [Paenirhodobacter enshiensis]KFI24452.1 hypothetical protein CG50_10165 [Paenirhodobacter enshiensis]